MNAIVQERYGPAEEVLHLRDIDPPVPGPAEVLVRVAASSVAGDDWHLVQGLPYVARPAIGLRAPKRRTPGLDVAGTVEATGSEVSDFVPGDAVFGWCGGAFAERVAVPAASLVRRPPGITAAQAAAVPISAITALQALRDGGGVARGQRVLIVGASGGVGTFAVQLARWMGAEPTAVCSGRNAALVRSLGAAHVVDYTAEDFARRPARYDVIVDMIGNRSLADCRRALAPRGTLVLVGGRGGRWFMGTDRWLRAAALSPFVRQRLRPFIHTDSREDLQRIAQLLEAGELRPVIDREVPLREVPRAIAHLASRRARGKVVIII